MQEIIPSLADFYSVATILFLMLLLAGISIYLNIQTITKYQRMLFWLKLVISILLLFLSIGLAVRFVVVFGVLMLVSGEMFQLLLYAALAFTPIVIYSLIVWGLIRWSQNKRFTDACVIIVITIFVGYVFQFQNPWFCKPFNHMGIGSEKECITKHDRELKELLNSFNKG